MKSKQSLSEASLEDLLVEIGDRAQPSELVVSEQAIEAMEDMFPGVMIDLEAIGIIVDEIVHK